MSCGRWYNKGMIKSTIDQLPTHLLDIVQRHSLRLKPIYDSLITMDIASRLKENQAFRALNGMAPKERLKANQEYRFNDRVLMELFAEENKYMYSRALYIKQALERNLEGLLQPRS